MVGRNSVQSWMTLTLTLDSIVAQQQLPLSVSSCLTVGQPGHSWSTFNIVEIR